MNVPRLVWYSQNAILLKLLPSLECNILFSFLSVTYGWIFLYFLLFLQGPSQVQQAVDL